MKKTTKRKFIVVLVGLIVAAAVAGSIWLFSGKKDSYCSVIPEDATALVRIDAAKFFSEHDVDASAIKMTTGLDAEELVKTCGIDFAQPIYGFGCADGKAGLVVPLKDVDAFREFLRNNTIAPVTLSASKGYEWAIGSQFAAIFDKQKCLFLTGAGMNVRKVLVELMEQDEDDSVLDESLYENIYACKKPFAAIVSCKHLPKEVMNNIFQNTGLDSDDLDMDLLMSLDAKKEKATLAFDLFANSSEARDIIKAQTDKMEMLKGKLVNTIDTDPLIWFSFSGLQHAAEQTDKLPNIKQLEKMGIDVKSLLSSFSGEAAIIVPNNNVEEVILLAEVQNNNVLSILNSLKTLSMGMVNAVQVGQDQYFLSVSGMQIFCGIKDGVFYATNSQVLSQKVGEQMNSNIAAYEDEITTSAAYMSINAEQAITALAKLDRQVRSATVLFGGRLSKLDRLYFSAKGTHAELVLCAKEGNDIIESLLN